MSRPLAAPDIFSKPRKRSRIFRIARATALVLIALMIWVGARHLFRPRPPPATDAQKAQAARVHIYRDTYGVPHIFGHSDADAAFGLAYAHAEDDWPTIQLVLAAGRGHLGLILPSKASLSNDYYVALSHIDEQVEASWPKIPADFRAVLEGYAAGINYYASLHPNEVDARLLPVSGKDIVAGFEHKLPLLMGAPEALGLITGATPLHAGDSLRIRASSTLGSNAHAVARARSTDDVTRLNINSHQPWEGPVAWYEAQVVSQEGWNMTGGLFPGAPMILHGHNDHLGWAHTVNHFHAIDIYELSMTDDTHYRVGTEVRELEASEAELDLDIGLFVLKLHKPVYRSVHGPVMKTDHGFYALRWPSAGHGALAAEQWFRMNKASNLEQWKAAMEMQGIPMFNTVYADRDSIGYIYNGSIPERTTPGIAVLAGDDPSAVWTKTLPFAELPQVWNPPSGFVFNCNTTPFHATEGIGNPNPSNYPANMGIEESLNNRGLRSLALFGGPGKISGADFQRYKFDRTYAHESALYREVVEPLTSAPPPDATESERAAIALLRSWNGSADEDSAAATLALFAWRAISSSTGTPKQGMTARAALDQAIEELSRNYGKLEVPLGEVQRLHRGKVDLPLGGGPDVLNAANTRVEGKQLIGEQGDSYILLVDFAGDGVHSRSISPYGASNRPDSPHYADQSPLFVKRELKPAWRTEAELRAHLAAEYAPGDEPRR